MLQEQLRRIQETFNEALQNEKQGVPEHVEHPPSHVDYVDSSIQNAIAFQYEGYSFIAITVLLIYAISDVCLLLSKSATVATLLGLRPSDEEYNELHAVLFYILTAFVVAHEYTHHVHGHVCLTGPETVFPNEILDTGGVGSMDGQIKEIAADGYSVYHVLANLIDGSGRSALTLLKLDAEPARVQDEVLFAFGCDRSRSLPVCAPYSRFKKDRYLQRDTPAASRENEFPYARSDRLVQTKPTGTRSVDRGTIPKPYEHGGGSRMWEERRSGLGRSDDILQIRRRR